MKNFIFTSITLLAALLSFGQVFGQSTFQTEDISIEWNCKPQMSQKQANTTYYTCNYQESGEVYIFSISVNDISGDLSQSGKVRDNYVTSFLTQIKKDVLNSGGKIISTTNILGQGSVQFSSINRIDSELTLKEYTAAFILGKNAYMINLIGDSENPRVESEFHNLVKNIKLN